MFFFENNLVRIALSDKAEKMLAPAPGLLESLFTDKKQGDEMKNGIRDLRRGLEKENIDLPGVNITLDQSLPPYAFKVKFGVAESIHDARKENWLGVLEDKAREFQIDDPSHEGINRLLETTHATMAAKGYHDAMQQLLVLYYWCSRLDHVSAGITVLVDIAAIYLINNDADNLAAALYVAQLAQALAEDDTFYDPYLKYQAHKCIACIRAIRGEAESAELYDQAFRDIERCGEPRYMVDALYNEASVCLALRDYERASAILDKIHSIIEKDDSYSKNDVSTIFNMFKRASKLNIEQMQQELEQLQAEYHRLKDDLFIQFANAAINIVSQVGPYLLTFATGGAFSGGGDINFGGTHIGQTSASGSANVVMLQR